MATFRVQKTRDYTVMSNYHFNDTRLSYKAMGILSKMLSLPDDWTFTLADLANRAKDGIDSVRAGIKELEQAGYITREQSRNKAGHFDKNVFNVYEKPQNTISSKEPEETPKAYTNKKKSTKNKPSLENPTAAEPLLENPSTVKSSTENPMLLNTNKLNTNINNQSIYQSKDIDKKIDRQIEADKKLSQQYEQYKHIFKANISYDTFVQGNDDVELIDEIIDIATETLAFQEKAVKINNNLVPADIVKKRLLELKKDDIDYVLFAFTRNTTKIHNIKAYILTSLYNAPTTKNHYFAAAVKSDFAERDGY